MRLGLLTAIAATAIAITAPQVRAQTSEDQQARALFDAGRTAYEAGRFDQALRYFRESYELSRRPALLFNIASSADRLLNIEEALQAYRDYLAAVPDAENRELAQSRIEFLEGRLAAQGGEAPETEAPSTGAANTAANDTTPGPRPAGGGDITGEWWFWTLIAVLVVGAGVGITAGVVVGTSSTQPPLDGDVPTTMTLVEWQ